MTNKEIARQFNVLAKVMELHRENPFKTRSYSSAYNTIRRLDTPLAEIPESELLEIPGIGKNIAAKITELVTTGEMSTLQRYLNETPPGIVELLGVKGLGAKKILTVWTQLGVESPGELLYACEENRLLDLKGFGPKTQASLISQLTYYFDSKGKYLYGQVIDEALDLLDHIQERYPEDLFEYVDDIARKMPLVECLQLVGTADYEDVEDWLSNLSEEEGMIYQGSQVQYDQVGPDEFDQTLFYRSASAEFLEAWDKDFGDIEIDQVDEDIFAAAGMNYIPPECRETPEVLQKAQSGDLQLIEESDIKGVIHAHSTYSDGAKSLKDMSAACQKRGYQYLLITDHSKSAFYANGLQVERVYQQWEEIDQLNAANPDFKIYKGIESDILYDGRLDYDEDILAGFDVIIASVHSQLKMDEQKATERLLSAIEHPKTRILGHPTGRLLLSREGYPIDYPKIIDACAEHNVVIELNANPRRLDLDWTWIPYAIERRVMISINPDAHSIDGIDDIRHGVTVARKALVQAKDNLCSLGRADFEQWIKS